jgi:hypothetical protein
VEGGGGCEQHAADRSVRVVARHGPLTPGFTFQSHFSVLLSAFEPPLALAFSIDVMRHDKMASWAGHEDEAILESVLRNGPRWSRVVEDIPGRSIASVRNRYLRIQRGAQMRSTGVAKNRCHACTRPLPPVTAPCQPLPPP